MQILAPILIWLGVFLLALLARALEVINLGAWGADPQAIREQLKGCGL